MSEYEEAVFVSYAWGGESENTVDELERAFADRHLQIVRDKKDLNYKGSIESFEQRIGQGQCIVLVISDKYLRSKHCMFELVEIDQNREFCTRVFPIVLQDAKIYEAFDRVKYLNYWEKKFERLNSAIKKLGKISNTSGITKDLEKYELIRRCFDHLADLLSDMNALTPDIHKMSGYSTLISAVEQVPVKGKQDQFVVNSSLLADDRNNPVQYFDLLGETGNVASAVTVFLDRMYNSKLISEEQRGLLIEIVLKASPPEIEKEFTMAPQQMNQEQVHNLYLKSSNAVAYYLRFLTEQHPVILNHLPDDRITEYVIETLSRIQQQVLLVAKVIEIHSPRNYETYEFHSKMIVASIKNLRTLLMDLDQYGGRRDELPSNIRMQFDREFNDVMFGASRILLFIQELSRSKRKTYLQ